MIKRLFSVKKFFNKQSVLFFFNGRIILNVLAKISEVFHGLAFSREVSDISWSNSKVIFPEFFRVRKLSIFIRASWIISLLILHHIDGLSKLFSHMLFYNFGQVTVKNFRGKIHALFFIGISVKKELMLGISWLSRSEKLRHQKILSFRYLISNIVAYSIFRNLQKVIFDKDWIVVMLFYCL
jgi:hypothetical protein